jgi:prevent-host-death family protein
MAASISTQTGLTIKAYLANVLARRTFMTVVTVHVAKTNLSKLLERAEAGDEIVIARGTEPVVKLVPVKAGRQRTFGLFRGLAKVGPEFFEPLSESELGTWEGEP